MSLVFSGQCSVVGVQWAERSQKISNEKIPIPAERGLKNVIFGSLFRKGIFDALHGFFYFGFTCGIREPDAIGASKGISGYCCH